MTHTCVLQTHVRLQRQGLLVNLKSARCFKTRDQYKCVRVTCHAVTGQLNSVASSAIMDNLALPKAAVRLTFSLHVSASKRGLALFQLFLHDILCPFKAEIQVRSHVNPWKIYGEQGGSGTGFCSECFCPHLSGSFHSWSIFIHLPN